MLVNMCITIVCQPDYDVINFKTNLSNQAVFLQDQKIKTKILNILKTKRGFKVKYKAFFIFKGPSVAKNCLRLESAPLRRCQVELIHNRLVLHTHSNQSTGLQVPVNWLVSI